MPTQSCYSFEDKQFRVTSPNVRYTEDALESSYEYSTTRVEATESGLSVIPLKNKFKFRTQLKVPRVGIAIVGIGGNNGSTVVGSILANQNAMVWNTKEGSRSADYVGSLTQAATVRLGIDATGKELYIPLRRLLPMVKPNDLVIGGWDISSLDMAASMRRAAVLPYDLQRQLTPMMQGMKPWPAAFDNDFVAANQADRADNVMKGLSKMGQVEQIRKDIREFKSKNSLDKVVVLWSANTERFSEVVAGVHDTADNLLAAIKRGESEIAPSVLYAVASILEGSSYINGSPQNTLLPGVVDLAKREGVFVGGDDFKSGQTKIKSVLVDFLVGAGIKPVSIVSYNHLGNNDGKNLSAPKQFRSKEISKSNVVDDMVQSNELLYAKGEHPDHTVVIKYVPFVKDSKRAMDEYTSEIFMGGHNTIVMHNTCEDSLLAAPLILDLVILTELFERIEVDSGVGFERLHPVLSLLGFLLKAPKVPEGTPVVNALFAQRAALVNFLKACSGLSPDSHMMLQHRLRAASKLQSQTSVDVKKTISSTEEAKVSVREAKIVV